MKKVDDAYIAVDFGAGSGRVIAGRTDGQRLEMYEIHRFANRQVRLGGHIYWDFLALFEEMKTGIRKAVRQGFAIRSIGIDTWGVDFGLTDGSGRLMGNPQCYRDPWTEGVPDEVFNLVPEDELYRRSGIQAMPINTVFQLCALKKEAPAMLEHAQALLFMPDLFACFLTGNRNTEYTIASTSGLLDITRREWNLPLADRLGLPRRIFMPVLMPGCTRGKLLPDVAAELGLPQTTEVIATGSHDTASALFAVPFPEGRESRCAFLSSGTWSLLGAELQQPVLTDEARRAGFSNEGCVGGGIKFLQNITGLWILQRLMRQWEERGIDTSYDTLLPAASQSPVKSLIDVDDECFANPADMQEAVAAFCLRTRQEVPASEGDYVMCVLRSLAERYRKGIARLNNLLPEPVEQLHIIGGGSRNTLLNRLTEEAVGLPVVAGPAEATAIGNIMVQAIAAGAVADRNSIEVLWKT